MKLSKSWEITDWYKGILATWVAVGIPSIVIGLGFSGGRIEPPDFAHDPFDSIVWLAMCGALLAPIWLAPFGIKRRT